MRPPIVLASSSPRRRELLASLGVPFQVVSPPVDESAFEVSHLSPPDLVCFLSRLKAQEVFKHRPEALVIGADTIVVLEGQVFGKPTDERHAFEMLNALQGRVHQVYSGITVFHPQDREDFPPMVSQALCTQVYMRALREAEIEAYIQTGESMDKAGAYAIQGHGGTLIERVDGCYFNVVGMSLYLLDRLFHQLGEPLALDAPDSSRPLSV